MAENESGLYCDNAAGVAVVNRTRNRNKRAMDFIQGPPMTAQFIIGGVLSVVSSASCVCSTVLSWPTRYRLPAPAVAIFLTSASSARRHSPSLLAAAPPPPDASS